MTDRTYLFNGAQLTFAKLIRATPDKEFASPTRSTLPLLAWWQGHSLPDEILTDDNYAIEVEAQVASTTTINAAGRPHQNRASCTDIMVRATSTAGAVEGKWTEPSYPTVNKWLGRNPSDNKLSVLEHWLKIIEPFSDGLDRDLVGGCTYQMVHRLASACTQGRDDVVMVYQLFGTTHRDRYIAELSRLRAALRPGPRLRLVLMVVPTETTPAWDRLRRGEPQQVRTAMLTDELFEFSEVEVVEV